ncbi:hypothetical protein ACLB2K_049532 [Fragaria x ananassa]
MCTIEIELRAASLQGILLRKHLVFCALYFGDEVVTKRNRPGRNADSTGSGNQNGLSVFAGRGRSLGSKKLIHLDHTEWDNRHIELFYSVVQKLHTTSDNKGSRETTKAAQARAHMEFPGWFSTHDKFKELEDEVINEGHEVTHEVQNELFNTVIGPEKGNRVRGYGCGVK